MVKPASLPPQPQSRPKAKELQRRWMDHNTYKDKLVAVSPSRRRPSCPPPLLAAHASSAITPPKDLLELVRRSDDIVSKAGYMSCAMRGDAMFERGRFYELYSARRDERLRQKKRETGSGAEVSKRMGPQVRTSMSLRSTARRSNVTERECDRVDRRRSLGSATFL